MILANEDAVLYICRYLHPDDITALARTDHDIRATIVPHMRYVVKNTSIRGLSDWTIRSEIIRPRFSRTDVVYMIPSADAFQPDPIPHDYTGVITIRRHFVHKWCNYSEYLWTRGGFVYRTVRSGEHMSKLIIMRITPIHFADYLCGGIDSTAMRSDPDESLIVDIMLAAYLLFDDNLGEGFRNFLRFELD